MTKSHPTLAAFALFVLASGCAEPVGVNTNALGKSGGTSNRGGATSTSTATSGGTTVTTTATESGGTTGTTTTTTTGSGGTTTTTTTTTTASGGTTLTTTTTGTAGATTTTTAVTPSSCGTPNGEVALTYTAQLGGDRIGGTTKIVPAAAASFPASDIVVKFCLSFISTGPATMSASNITLYDAAIQGQPYFGFKELLKGTIEEVSSNHFCIVFDMSTVAAAASRTFTSADSMTIDWRYVSLNFGAGAMIDPTEGNEPIILVSRAGVVAACQTTKI